MADYTIAADEIAAHAKTLTADAEDTVTFAGYESSPVVLVHPTTTNANTPVYVTCDGSEATVAGPNTRPVWPGQQINLEALGPDPTVIRVISAAAHTYSVEA